MNINILTPDQEIFTGAIQSVKVPGVKGEFEVLKNHAAIVSSLGPGKVRVRPEGGKDITFQIERGFIEVLNNEIALLVQGVEELS